MRKYNTLWLFAAGMRRSGSTLQFYFAKELIERMGGFSVGWTLWQEFKDTYKIHDGQHPIVLLKVHAFVPVLVPTVDILFKRDKAKALTIFRDPRDVAASMLEMEKENFLEGTWDEVLCNIPVALQEFSAWSALPEEQCLVQSYDQKPEKLLDELAKFLDISCPPAWGDKCLARHTLDAHKKIIQEYNGRCDLENLLWYNHIGKSDGKTGRYKDDLTPEQIVQIEKIIDDWKSKL